MDAIDVDSLLAPFSPRLKATMRPHYRALVAGATGATGRELVALLLADPCCLEVTALTRSVPKSLTDAFPGVDVRLAVGRLTVTAVDWEALQRNPMTYASIFQGQHFVAMCMGTTKREAGSAEAFRKVELDYVTTFATAVKSMGSDTVRHYSQVSSQGANSNHVFLFRKTKGEAEQAVLTRNFPRTSIFRPKRLYRGDKARWSERMVWWTTWWLPMVWMPPAMIPARSLAKAMFIDFMRADDSVRQTRTSSGRVFEVPDILRIVNTQFIPPPPPAFVPVSYRRPMGTPTFDDDQKTGTRFNHTSRKPDD